MEEPHMHDAKDEYLFFTGADLMDPFKSFDAEISIMLGEDPDHMEEYTITAPSVVRIPLNFWHCPVNFKRVGKPVKATPHNSRHTSCLHNVPPYCPKILANTGSIHRDFQTI